MDPDRITSNVRGRKKAEAAIELLLGDLDDSEVAAAMRVLRSQADNILGPAEAPHQELGKMDDNEALSFRRKACEYQAFRGVLWKDVPRDYIERIADFGLELQRYLRSDLGAKH